MLFKILELYLEGSGEALKGLKQRSSDLTRFFFYKR